MSEQPNFQKPSYEELLRRIRTTSPLPIESVSFRSDREVIVQLGQCSVQVPYVIDPKWFHGSPAPFPLKTCPDWLLWSAAWWNFTNGHEDPRQIGKVHIEVGDYILLAIYERDKDIRPFPPFRLAEIVGASERTSPQNTVFYTALEKPFRYIPPDQLGEK